MSRKHRDPRDARAAIDRYEYVLATGQHDQVYRVHQEAFAELSDEQRVDLRARLSAEIAAEADRPIDDRVETLARVATDLEAARPGTLPRALGPLLPVVAGSIMASPVAIALFPYDYAAGTEQWATGAEEDGEFF
ncbi:hypothetical protein KNO15_10140 [Leifsonia shinshuensis]|uniref:hypothetical protein n=1 Tax=Leifsonia shinshuensis TaxID=150026 RepID=UPI001F5126A6|nr:hypothetical protein [Leifsonia shinshuensis]MCI0157054.1 hypothetical protein [Leifsonia shinshuensis]